jgi:hypothetical protein
MNEKGVTNRGPKKRDPACFQTQHAILIPAGTILRQQPGAAGLFDCPVAFGKFTIERTEAEAHPDDFKKVIA